jgi:hypothetical protein
LKKISLGRINCSEQKKVSYSADLHMKFFRSNYSPE